VNRNPHSVSQVIITCEMFDERGHQIGSKSTALLTPFPPGETRVSGIEFPRRFVICKAGLASPCRHPRSLMSARGSPRVEVAPIPVKLFALPDECSNRSG
jgi:hypothetical protein